MKLNPVQLVAIALGLGALTLAALVPSVSIYASHAGLFLLGVAVPSGMQSQP